MKPTLKGCDCCLSGVENLSKKLIDEGKSPEYVSAFCLKYIEQTLSEMTKRLLEKYGEIPLLFAGGVMSNQIIKILLKKNIMQYSHRRSFRQITRQELHI